MTKTEAQIRAQRNYERNQTVKKSLQFTRNNDADIIEHIEQIDNFQGYIKSLIREDIKRLNK